MTFWTYMLHCRGGSFFVGHTDDLERRIGEHKSGLVAGFTANRMPVELVWSGDFQTRDEAKAAEKRIKGWSRAKKLALIRGDWDRISALARRKDSASTSSARTGKGAAVYPESACPELVGELSFALLPHPGTPPFEARAVSGRISMTELDDMLIEFRVEGSDELLLPLRASAARRDGLWQATCFEMFLKCEDGRYFEFNLSPSSEWAIYAFDGYRSGMRPLEVDVAPQIESAASAGTFLLEANIGLGEIPCGNLALSLCAVIAEKGGRKSYWALAHPPGDPDFHHPACFAARLEAPPVP